MIIFKVEREKKQKNAEKRWNFLHLIDYDCYDYNNNYYHDDNDLNQAN